MSNEVTLLQLFKIMEGKLKLLSSNMEGIILDWWNRRYQMLTLHNPSAVGVFEGVESIFLVKTTNSSIQNCNFNKDCLDRI